MPVKDLDIESALAERSRWLGTAVSDFGESGTPEWGLEVIRSLWSSQIYVWEPSAVEAMERFWARWWNRKRFAEAFMSEGIPRFIDGVLQPSFHFFPSDGIFLDPDTLPAKKRNPWGDQIFSPTTRAISYHMCEHAQRIYIGLVLVTTHINKDAVDFSNVARVHREISSLPRRDVMTSPYMAAEIEWRPVEVKNGLPSTLKSLLWLKTVYKMRIFLEQPFVGHKRFRQPRRPSRHGRVEQEGLDIVKVSMREPLKVPVPKFILPPMSRVTGKPLEFEVEVRAHLRHYASGKVGPVTAHTRGPKGIKRERVIKVVR